MAVFRFLLLLALVVSALAFVFYAVTGQARYRKFGLRMLVSTIGAGLFFFAVLIAENLFYSQ
jgi:hypothetical protein